MLRLRLLRLRLGWQAKLYGQPSARQLPMPQVGKTFYQLLQCVKKFKLTAVRRACACQPAGRVGQLEKRVKDYFEGKTGFENLPEDEKWCIFIKYRHEQEAQPLINDLCVKEEGIMRAEQQIVKLDRGYLRYMRNLSAEKDKIDLAYKMGAAHREGQKERDRAIAMNALAEGSTPEFVQKITGLDLETIQELIMQKKKE